MQANPLEAPGDWAVAMNDLGTVVGIDCTYEESLDTGEPIGWETAFVRPGGTIPGKPSEAAAINRRGQVVGTACTAKGCHAFVWQKGRLTDLGTLGGKSSRAVAINDDGAVVGSSATKSGAVHAFLWQKGRMSDLGTLGGATSEAVAINRRDQVVGWSDTRGKSATGQHAVLWQSGRAIDLGAWESGSPPVSSLGDADGGPALNERGQVVGQSGGSAVLWQGGRLTRLPLLPGAKGSAALAINEHDQIVGWSNGTEYGSHAVLWTLKPGA